MLSHFTVFFCTIKAKKQSHFYYLTVFSFLPGSRSDTINCYWYLIPNTGKIPDPTGSGFTTLYSAIYPSFSDIRLPVPILPDIRKTFVIRRDTVPDIENEKNSAGYMVAEPEKDRYRTSNEKYQF